MECPGIGTLVEGGPCEGRPGGEGRNEKSGKVGAERSGKGRSWSNSMDERSGKGRSRGNSMDERSDKGKSGSNSMDESFKTMTEAKRIITDLVTYSGQGRSYVFKDMVSSSSSSDEQETTEEPPEKKLILEDRNKQKKIKFRRKVRTATDLSRKVCKGPSSSIEQQCDNKSGWGSSQDSNENTGVPKKTNGIDCSTKPGFGPGKQYDTDHQADIEDSVSSSETNNYLHWAPRSHPVKPKPRPPALFTPEERMLHRRQKILKLSHENMVRVKALQNHSAKDKDISELLREFTVTFLIAGYSKLVQDLLTKFMAKEQGRISMDKSHFLWLVTYFLKFACPLEIGLEEIGSVLSVETIGYIIYEGVEIVETLKLASTRLPRSDTSPELRRMHLVVTAIREYLQVGVYKVPCLPWGRKFIRGRISSCDDGKVISWL